MRGFANLYLRECFFLGTWVNRIFARCDNLVQLASCSWCRPRWRRNAGQQEGGESFYVGRGEHGIGPPFYRGPTQGGLGRFRRDDGPDYISHTKLLPDEPPDREGTKRALARLSAAVSKVRVVVEDQAIADDKVITRFTVHATHDRGTLFGVAPTGRQMSDMAVAMYRISGGKIAEEWNMGTIDSTMRDQRLEQEERERERIEQELLVARRIQHASLPKEVPTLEGWQITPFYQPAWEVGGDFYDFFELDEERLGVVVGDATGKGVPAALVAEATSNMLRALAQGLGRST